MDWMHRLPLESCQEYDNPITTAELTYRGKLLGGLGDDAAKKINNVNLQGIETQT